MYISLTTRPDVAYSVGVLSRFMACPTQRHVDAAKRVILYLNGTRDHGILYSKKPIRDSRYEERPPHDHSVPHAFALSEFPAEELDAYADADHAGDVDSMRSTTGFVVMMHGGIVSWMSKLQPTVALSTTEAETIAAVETLKQVMHLRLLLRELGVEQKYPTPIYEDNRAAGILMKKSENSKKTKYYQLKVHFLNENHNVEYRVVHVPTVLQLADTFTKALPRDLFGKFRFWMGVRPNPSS